MLNQHGQIILLELKKPVKVVRHYDPGKRLDQFLLFASSQLSNQQAPETNIGEYRFAFSCH
ncbi:hypothetical protein KPSA1_00419 [Pseudomonas syringae pv. actinidiae]|uniref:Uncharacterized protein n=1 Tax=Pseudomonas syringae pv. actinidiae TaxID=103796 RepID=A0A2V0Q3L5_PSESF|nr:hypothetical protein KPSA1_00419 [Pseudomonas syringae pv. actinidiae]